MEENHGKYFWEAKYEEVTSEGNRITWRSNNKQQVVKMCKLSQYTVTSYINYTKLYIMKDVCESYERDIVLNC